MKSLGLVCILSLTLASVSMAQDSIGDKAEINGKVFTDYYWFAQSHNRDIEGNHGFRFRRIYFTYNQEITDAFSTRLRLEMDSDDIFASSASKMSPVVKDAYLKWTNDEHQVLAGISGTPTWGLVEDVWGYRSVEKSPLDLFGLGSSRDFGLAAKGQLDGNGRFNYHLMVGNGNSNRGNEINKGKKVMASFSAEVINNLVLEVYADWNDNTGETDWMTLQGFGAWQTENFAIGALYAFQRRNNAAVNGDLDVQLASLFTHFRLADNVKAFARADYAFEGIPGTDDNDYLPISSVGAPTVLIGGYDFQLGSGVNLQPNAEVIFYRENAAGFTPTTDIVPRMTLFYSF